MPRVEGIVGRVEPIKPRAFRLCSPPPLLCSLRLPAPLCSRCQISQEPSLRAICSRSRRPRWLICRARHRGCLQGTECAHDCGTRSGRRSGGRRFDAWLRGGRCGCSGRGVVQPVEARAGIGHDEVRKSPQSRCLPLPLPLQRFVLRSWCSRAVFFLEIKGAILPSLLRRWCLLVRRSGSCRLI
jgi:hypothetical protein